MDDVLKYKNYYAAVHFNAEDDVFFGKILGINDLVSFEGTTVTELRTAFHEAVDDYLETCKRLNKQPDKAYKGSFNVRVPIDLHREAATYAAAKNITLNDFIKKALGFVLHQKPDLDAFYIGGK